MWCIRWSPGLSGLIKYYEICTYLVILVLVLLFLCQFMHCASEFCSLITVMHTWGLDIDCTILPSAKKGNCLCSPRSSLYCINTNSIPLESNVHVMCVISSFYSPVLWRTNVTIKMTPIWKNACGWHEIESCS